MTDPLTRSPDTETRADTEAWVLDDRPVLDREHDTGEAQDDRAHWSRLVDRLRERLEHYPPTDPNLLQRLVDEHAAARRALDRTTLATHWSTGAGDRRFF